MQVCMAPGTAHFQTNPGNPNRTSEKGGSSLCPVSVGFHGTPKGCPSVKPGLGRCAVYQALAKQCVVFNCSPEMDYIMVGKFFKGAFAERPSGRTCCFEDPFSGWLVAGSHTKGEPPFWASPTLTHTHTSQVVIRLGVVDTEA